MHDTTAARVEGIDAQLNAYPQVKVLVDAGYRGLAKEHPAQVSAPPLKLRPGAAQARQTQWEAERKDQSSRRIPAWSTCTPAVASTPMAPPAADVSPGLR